MKHFGAKSTSQGIFRFSATVSTLMLSSGNSWADENEINPKEKNTENKKENFKHKNTLALSN